MRFTELFNFRGRVSRMTWWLCYLGSIIALYATIFLAAAIEQSGSGGGSSGWTSPSGLLALIALLGILWFNLSITAKRWHDRDKSGWWMLIGLVPVIGLWAIIEPGFLRGTEGQNRFGINPIGD